MKQIGLVILMASVFSACSNQAEKVEKDWMMAPFVKADEFNPVLLPNPNSSFYCPIRQDSVKWEEKDVFNPAALNIDGIIYMLYRAEDVIGAYNGTSRIGLASSSDGLNFVTEAEPVLFPDHDELNEFEWEGGVEDPRIVEDENGVYYLTYTAYNGDKARLFIASSPDLRNWTKHGSIFKNYNDGELVKIWSKAGSILTKRVGDKLVVTKIDNKYWMYWGESNIYAATSPDLINWSPVEENDPAKQSFDEHRNHRTFKVVFGPREKMFDSYLVEPGPPAILTENGILFLYNSRNDPENGDPNFAPGTYAAGQVLLDPQNPLKVIDRTDLPFFYPDKVYEITGQVNNVTFIEGIVPKGDTWFLYYGTADSKIAVATFSE